ncbi:MAG: cytochrome C oxidase subunit III [Chitinophagaceae bacterium]|nr:MAG: cytochrome C oxidase subunit III [Chitinophagaceae bacterium]
MSNHKKNILLLLAASSPFASWAQATLIPQPPKPTNYLESLMLIVAVLLVLVILVLSSVLTMISKKVVEIAKKLTKAMFFIFVIAGSLFSTSLHAQTAMITDSVAKAPADFYGGMSYNSFWTLSTVMMLEMFVIFILVIFIRSLWKVVHPVEVAPVNSDPSSVTHKQSWLLHTWHRLDAQFFTKAAPIEKEADILLDHNYDGIRELDNALPPWWKYGFYITIVVAVFYFLKFEVWHTGQNPTEEYATEMTEAKISTNAYLASMKENVDENTVTELDAKGVAAGKVLFAKTCVPCHLAEGQGLVGPNLTDEYWIHGGGIKDIFKTIKYGYPDKAMQSWQSTYSPVQIQQLATFIRSLKGTHPTNPKAPQGNLYVEGSKVDSAVHKANVKDSVPKK